MIAQQVLAIACADCGRKYQWKKEIAGRKVICKCGSSFVMPNHAPPAQSCASTAVDTPAATATATTGMTLDDPKLQKENILQTLQSDFSTEIRQAKQGTKTATTSADEIDQQHYCPKCRAIMLPGTPECNCCGYSPSSPEFQNPLKDKLVASLLAGGITALITAIAFAWLAYGIAELYKWIANVSVYQVELGFLGLPLAWFTIIAMRRRKSEWGIWHTVAAWSYIAGAYIIFRTAEAAWVEIHFFSILDLLYLPLLGFVSYKLITKASRKRLVL